MKKLMLGLFILLVGNILLSEKVIILPELSKPHYLALDNNQVYILERSSVFIYSQKNFKLVKKFGKRGEGPGEFKGMIRFVIPQTESLFFNSTGKISIFGKDGNFKEEFKIPHPDMKIKPLGENYVGTRAAFDKGLLYNIISLYGPDFKKIEELHRQLDDSQMPGKGTRFFVSHLPFHTTIDRAFIVKENEFVIKVHSTSGKKLYDITYKNERTVLPESRKKQIINYLKTDPNNARYFKQMQPIIFPEYFPAIQEYHVSNGKLYVFTYKKKENKNQLLIFDLKGNFLKSLFVPFRNIYPFGVVPTAINNGKMYQVVENEKNENWELHITLVD